MASHRDSMIATPAANTALVVLSFLVVYLVWGSTYLAIRYGIETMPPLLMAGFRFLIAGGLLYGATRVRVRERLTGRQVWNAVLIGVLLFAGGNGLVCLSQQSVPSGLASLFIATQPMWIVCLEAIFVQRAWPRMQIMVGLLIGLGGLFILVNPIGGGSFQVNWLGALGLLAACISWSVGSLRCRYVDLPRSLFLTSAIQMLGGGVALICLGTFWGDWSQLDVSGITLRSWGAFAYLILFGSILALTAYTYLLRVCNAASVSTYAYINPIVAMLLGVAWAGEPFTWRMAVASAFILGAVVMILAGRKSTRLQLSKSSKSVSRTESVKGQSRNVDPVAVDERAIADANC